jgi:hypothetical protein
MFITGEPIAKRGYALQKHQCNLIGLEQSSQCVISIRLDVSTPSPDVFGVCVEDTAMSRGLPFPMAKM